MQHLTLVHSAPRPTACGPASYGNGFSSRDRITLEQWTRRSDAHGYRRVLVEGGSDAGGPEEGAYVLLYTQDSVWARWGIARAEDGILIWHCGTGADLGRFGTIIEALESLPPARVDRDRSRPQPPVVMPRLALVHSA